MSAELDRPLLHYSMDSERAKRRQIAAEAVQEEDNNPAADSNKRVEDKRPEADIHPARGRPRTAFPQPGHELWVWEDSTRNGRQLVDPAWLLVVGRPVAR